MAQESQLRLADVFTCQEPGQHQIQDRHAVVQGARRHTQKRNVAQIGDQKHGSRQDGRAIVKFGGPGLADAVAGYVVRVDAHAAGEQQQIAAPIQLGTDDAQSYRRRPERNPERSLPIPGRHFVREHGGEAILDEAMIDLIAGDHDTHPGVAQSPDREHRAVLRAMAAALSMDARFMMSGIARVAATSWPFCTRVWLWRVAHMTSSTRLKAASAAVLTRKSPSLPAD